MAWKRPAVPTVHRIDGSGLPQAGADPARLQSGNRPPSPDRRLARRPVPAAPPGFGPRERPASPSGAGSAGDLDPHRGAKSGSCAKPSRFRPVAHPRARRRLARLPLQSPGICVYLAVKGKIPPPYLRFHLPGGGELCRLLIAPSAVAPEEERNGWWPARLIAPMRHAEAEEGGPEKQREYLQRILGESWWKEYAPEHRVLAARIPAEWGSEFHLHRDSMNPVMTASFMRAGRLAHRSPFARGLYLAGSSTHPGQWVSFCAI